MNDPDTIATSKKTDRTTRILIWVFVVFLLLLVGYVSWMRILERRYDLRIDRIRANGYPTSAAEELNLYYKSPDSGSNAAKFYERAIKVMVTSPDFERTYDSDPFTEPIIIKPWDPWSEKRVEAFSAYLDLNQPVFEWTEKAADLPECRFNVDYVKNGWLESMKVVRPLSFRLNCRARLAAEKHDSELAVSMMMQSWALQCAILQEPEMTSYGEGGSMLRTNGQTLERVLNRIRLNDSQLVKLSETIKRSRTKVHDALIPAFIGQHALLTSLYERADSDIESRMSQDDRMKPAYWLSRTKRFIYLNSGTDILDRCKQLDLFEKQLDLLKLGFAERRVAAEKMEAPDISPDFVTRSRANGTSISALLLMIDSDEAQALCLETGIAVERFRLVHEDRLPEKLEELVPRFLPSVPLDPFTGKALAYRRLKGGYCVYSINDQDCEGLTEYDDPALADGERGSFSIRRPALNSTTQPASP